MIVYFTDRNLNMIGHASNKLRKGLVIVDDMKQEDTDTGVAIFECTVAYDKKTLGKVDECTKVGNYILRRNGDEKEFYTIIDREKDTKKQEVYIYAEDAGLDLLNEVVGPYSADKAYSLEYYVNKYASGSGFEIGINEASGLTRKLSWDGEATAAARIASVATQFDGCEISYSFETKGLYVTKKYINIYKERGKDIGIQLRLNRDIDRIITKESIANLATALQCTGGTPESEGEEEAQPITLKGYSYDDGDFYVDGDVLKSREALKTWSRYLWRTDATQETGGHITKQYSYDTTSQATLCSHAITELKKIREIEVNYEVDITKLPDNVKIGDRVNIIDDASELYVSARVLKLESSVVNQNHTATLGEYLIKGSGISQKVADLAAQFAKNAQSAARALAIAKAAKENAAQAQNQADSALLGANAAQIQADEAKAAAEAAQASASAATEAANNAEAAVDDVEKDVEGLQATVANAQAAADQAQQAAQTAETKATEAQEASVKAAQDAADAKTAAGTAQETADSAVQKADTAQGTADTAKAKAEEAATTAAAAKQDAENAQAEIDSLGENLTTVENTMKADYARKTDLTEAEASLQSQISQNAAQISSTVTKVQEIDETANNAAEQAQAAQTAAQAAQAQADEATADAEAAQAAADEAAIAAANAQSQADTAQAAADEAQSVADKAEADLEAAKSDLATVSGRVDATEEEIAAAQEAVNTAQDAADKAKADAAAAVTKATSAQDAADQAVTNAEAAQTAAQDAANKATIAQATAEAAKGDAAAAQATADEAKANAANAQSTANTAKANAENAQATADEAAAQAAAAQDAADEAEAKAAQAQSDLEAAEQNLADVTSRVGATEAEVEAAQAAVEQAKAAADAADAAAAAAQSTADTAKANAAAAQTAANNAKTAADNAQQAADEAQDAADAAQADVDALAVRVTTAETKITQTSEQIALLATKEEVTQTLGGYYTKEETEALVQVESDSIILSVSNTYATKQEVANIEIGGRNLAEKTQEDWTDTNVSQWSGGINYFVNGTERHGKLVSFEELGLNVGDDFTISIDLNAINKSIKLRVDLYRGSTLGENYVGKYTETVEKGTNKRVSYVGTVTEEYINFAIYVGNHDTNNASTTVEQYKCLKIEKGNRATDWTPAPEDVEQYVNDTAEEIHQTITEQNTAITQNCQEIILSALEDYVKTGDYEAYKSTVETQLSLMAGEISMKFTEATDQTTSVDSDLQETKEPLLKHFKFTENGLAIKAGENTMELLIDNDMISFTKNGEQFGWWDGVDFHTGNIVVEVNERAQFGNFAFVPRSDESLMFLKVGG